jgi:hypothetical protein
MSELSTKSIHHSIPYGTTRDHIYETETSGWAGWVGFAGILMIISGILQAISGLVGIYRSAFFLVTNNSSHLLVFQNVHTWGWINLIVGTVVLLAGTSLFRGTTWSRVVAVILVAISIIANLVAMPLYPLWSMVAITIGILVMYAVVVHGSELREQ